MPIPLAVAAPAAAASLAYLQARTQIGHDFSLIVALAGANIRAKICERKDRVNLFYVLEEHAKAKSTANHPFFVYQGKSWTFKETYDIVLSYGTLLKTKYGVSPKEVVALDAMNSPKFVFLWLSLWALGATPAFINFNLTGKPLLHCLKTSTARMVFVDDEIKSNFTPEVLDALSSPSFRDGKGSVDVIDLDAEFDRVAQATAGVREPDSARSGPIMSTLAVLIYTSGTTGLPKPAVVSWGKFFGGGSITGRWMGWSRKDILYTCMPLYHSTATVLGFAPALQHGATVVVGHKFSNKTFWQEVRASNATIIQYVGETCRYLLAAPPLLDPVTGENLDKKNKVRVAFGNGMRPDVWNRFKERFDIEAIAEFYSATESAGSSWNLSRNDFSAGAIGRLGTLARFLTRSQSVVVKVDPETDELHRDPITNLCTKITNDEPGELLYALDPADIKSKYQGYFGNEKASNSKIIRDVITKGDAWFRSGDLIRLDSEGRIWFCDRIGDTFRWKSENVSTNEVSEVLGLHPAVVEANVYGVQLPHHEGRAGCVATVFNRGVDKHLLDGLASHAIKGLPKYAIPVFLRVVKETQATGNNKQQKHILRGHGVDPAKVGTEDKMYWLNGGTYKEFSEKDWAALQSGTVKL